MAEKLSATDGDLAGTKQKIRRVYEATDHLKKKKKRLRTRQMMVRADSHSPKWESTPVSNIETHSLSDVAAD